MPSGRWSACACANERQLQPRHAPDGRRAVWHEGDERYPDERYPEPLQQRDTHAASDSECCGFRCSLPVLVCWWRVRVREWSVVVECLVRCRDVECADAEESVFASALDTYLSQSYGAGRLDAYGRWAHVGTLVMRSA